MADRRFADGAAIATYCWLFHAVPPCPPITVKLATALVDPIAEALEGVVAPPSPPLVSTPYPRHRSAFDVHYAHRQGPSRCGSATRCATGTTIASTAPTVPAFSAIDCKLLRALPRLSIVAAVPLALPPLPPVAPLPTAGPPLGAPGNPDPPPLPPATKEVELAPVEELLLVTVIADAFPPAAPAPALPPATPLQPGAPYPRPPAPPVALAELDGVGPPTLGDSGPPALPAVPAWPQAAPFIPFLPGDTADGYTSDASAGDPTAMIAVSGIAIIAHRLTMRPGLDNCMPASSKMFRLLSPVRDRFAQLWREGKSGLLPVWLTPAQANPAFSNSAGRALQTLVSNVGRTRGNEFAKAAQAKCVNGRPARSPSGSPKKSKGPAVAG